MGNFDAMILRFTRFFVAATILIICLIATYQTPLYKLSDHISRKHHIVSDRVAVIVEDRPLANLVPLILHFATVLGPTWQIVLYNRNNTAHYFSSSTFDRLLGTSQILHRQLPDTISFSDHASVSTFLTQPWIWTQLAPAKHVLLFQADSVICSNAPQTVDAFLEYDFIGAPIHPDLGHGYNGGLSLRNRDMMLDIIQANNFATSEEDYEDQFFYAKMRALPDKADGTPGANLPSEDVAKTFAVESIFYETPLGYHQAGRYQAGSMKQIESWCPEIKLCDERLLVLKGKTPEEERRKKEEEEKLKKEAEDKKQKVEDDGKKKSEEKTEEKNRRKSEEKVAWQWDEKDRAAMEFFLENTATTPSAVSALPEETALVVPQSSELM